MLLWKKEKCEAAKANIWQFHCGAANPKAASRRWHAVGRSPADRLVFGTENVVSVCHLCLPSAFFRQSFPFFCTQPSWDYRPGWCAVLSTSARRRCCRLAAWDDREDLAPFPKRNWNKKGRFFRSEADVSETGKAEEQVCLWILLVYNL